MAESATLEQLPMTLGYFRLILRRFGETPGHRTAILAGTGVTEEMLQDPSADISLYQQVRQLDNVIGMFGDDWALRAPELWNPISHGPLGVAGIAAPNFASMIDVIVRFSFVRAPFYALSLRRGTTWSQLDYDLTVLLDERHWRPMIEISFMAIRGAIASILAAQPTAARFFFSCAEPGHAPAVRSALGGAVVYSARRNAIRFPTAWLALQSPFADATLYSVALAELQAARKRITEPVRLRGRVERLLASLSAKRMTADEAARLTAVSRRTLVRRLAESGVGYRQLVDAERQRRAEQLLREGGLSHAQIAEELGYADPTSFSRACRRWFGSGEQ